MGVSDERFVPGLAALAERVHRHGAKVAMQLQHAGKTSVRDLAEGRELWVPSMPPPLKTDMMQALTREELGAFISSSKGREKAGVKIRVMDKADIAQMAEWFAAAAERAQRAGFDGVEIHAAHSYIIAGFLSPYYNTRDDEYGGPLENRARMLLEVIAAVRARVGADFPVWLRLDAEEIRTPGGITLDDAKAVARMAEAAGVDAVSVSAYANTSTGVAFTEAPLVQQKAGFLSWTAAIKSGVRIPVIAVGRLEPEVADTAIGAGQCDFVAMARKLLADPELPPQARREPAGGHPAVHLLLRLREPDLHQPARQMRGESANRPRVRDPPEPGGSPRPHCCGGRRPGRHGGGPGRRRGAAIA